MGELTNHASVGQRDPLLGEARLSVIFGPGSMCLGVPLTGLPNLEQTKL